MSCWLFLANHRVAFSVEDMFMLSVHGGKERTIADFVSLFEQADARFKYMGTTGGVNGAFQSLLEFAFQG